LQVFKLNIVPGTPVGVIKTKITEKTGIPTKDQEVWVRYVLRNDDSEIIGFDEDELVKLKISSAPRTQWVM
jgi:hypothetical protein